MPTHYWVAVPPSQENCLSFASKIALPATIWQRKKDRFSNAQIFKKADAHTFSAPHANIAAHS
jgi:hypothetical protein